MPGARNATQDVRTATVAAATRLFASRGFDGTALQDIADAVGVTKPAVLHHYPSKEHVRQAVLDSILEHWNRTLPRLLLAATESHDRFEGIVGELTRFFAEEPDRARILLRETLDRPADFRKTLQRVLRPWLSTIADYIRTGRDAGRHHSDVDGEAYVLHVIQLVVAGCACGAVTSTLLEGGDGPGRYDRELARIARSSLFTEKAAASQARARRGRRSTGRRGT